MYISHPSINKLGDIAWLHTRQEHIDLCTVKPPFQTIAWLHTSIKHIDLCTKKPQQQNLFWNKKIIRSSHVGSQNSSP